MEIETKDGIVLRNIPEGTPDAVIKARIAQIRAGAPQPQQPQESAESPASLSGRRMNSSAQGAINALQGPTMGFLDELAGVGGSLASLQSKFTPNFLLPKIRSGISTTPIVDEGSVADAYRNTRDTVRGATTQFREDHPILAPASSIAASAPTLLAAPVRAAAAAPAITRSMTLGQKLLQQAKPAAAYGAISGAGESHADNLEDLAKDTAEGAGMSVALGGALQLGGNGVMAVGRNVAQRFNQSAAAQQARLLLAKALGRDAEARGPIVAVNPENWVAARAANRGPRATIADSAGENTRQTLDTLAVLPGSAKDKVEALIHSRQAARGRVLTNDAADALGVEGKDYLATLGNLVKEKREAGKPFYAALEGEQYKIDQELQNLLQRTQEAHAEAEKKFMRTYGSKTDLSKLSTGGDVGHRELDQLKKTLFDMEQVAKRQGELGKASDFTNLRRALTEKIDKLAPKDEMGVSLYQRARNAFAGKAELEEALRAGRTVMKEGDPLVVKELTRGMSESEREVFNIGVLQAIREKVGTDAGQTSLLKMWRNPAMSDRLKDVFGGSYRQFAQAVAKERALKGVESIGRGSQTAARLLGAGDMDAVTEALKTTAGATMAGAFRHPIAATSAVLNEAGRVWNKVKTPETVRNELAKLLLLNNSHAQTELRQTLPQVIAEHNRRAAAAAAATGVGASQLQRRY